MSGRAERQNVSFMLRSQGRQHRFGVNSLATSQDGKLLYSAGRDASIRCWDVTGASEPSWSGSLEGHTDWVNDLLVCGRELLVSCSSDRTVKLWAGADRGHQNLATLHGHTDYVKALACSPVTKKVASCSLDRQILIWDIEATTATELLEDPAVSLTGHAESIYSIAMNDAGTTIVSGSTEPELCVWDPRSGKCVATLRGHTDHVRTVAVNSAGTICASGSSDGTLRIWDLGQQRCLFTCQPHNGSVWATSPTADFQEIVSAGRDGSVCTTSVQAGTSVPLISAEAVASQHTRHKRLLAPLKLALAPDNSRLWMSTTCADICEWETDLRAGQQIGASPQAPSRCIRGLPGLVRHQVLNNRRDVATQDEDGLMEMWDVTTGLSKELGRETADRFDEVVEELSKQDRVAVPSWFSLDTKLGSLAIHLTQSQAFGAEVYITEAGIPDQQCDEETERKVNLGEHVLRALFAKYPRQEIEAEDGDDEETEEEAYIKNLPPPYEYSGELPVLVKTQDGRVLLHKKVVEVAGTEALPQWVADCVVLGRRMGREIAKLNFQLQPHPGLDPASVLGSMTLNKLSAPGILRMSKVVAYVEGKLNAENEKAATEPSINESDVEIVCKQEVLSTVMNLRSVQRFIWKQPDDVILHFRYKVS